MWRREKKQPIAKVTAASFGELILGLSVNKVDDRWVKDSEWVGLHSTIPETRRGSNLVVT